MATPLRTRLFGVCEYTFGLYRNRRLPFQLAALLQSGNGRSLLWSSLAHCTVVTATSIQQTSKPPPPVPVTQLAQSVRGFPGLMLSAWRYWQIENGLGLETRHHRAVTCNSVLVINPAGRLSEKMKRYASPSVVRTVPYAHRIWEWNSRGVEWNTRRSLLGLISISATSSKDHLTLLWLSLPWSSIGVVPILRAPTEQLRSTSSRTPYMRGRMSWIEHAHR